MNFIQKKDKIILYEEEINAFPYPAPLKRREKFMIRVILSIYNFLLNEEPVQISKIYIRSNDWTIKTIHYRI